MTSLVKDGVYEKDALNNEDISENMTRGKVFNRVISIYLLKLGTSESEDGESIYLTGIKLCLLTKVTHLTWRRVIATAIPLITDQFHSLDNVGWYGSGSLICDGPSNSTTLIGRTLAGLGSAGGFSGAYLKISTSVPLARRPTFTGLIGGMYGIASVINDVTAYQSGIRNILIPFSVVLGTMFSGSLVSNIGYSAPFMLASTALASIGAGMLTTSDLDTGFGKWIGYQIIRKVKCDRRDPCGQCSKCDLECIFPVRRNRALGGKPATSESRDAELLHRIKRLEEMLANQVPGAPNTPEYNRPSGSFVPTLLQPLSNDSDVAESLRQGLTVDNHYAAFMKEQRSSSRHLNEQFWLRLSDEFDSLRELIGDPAENEDGFDSSTITALKATSSSPSFVFPSPDNFATTELVHPSDAQREVLFQFYFANVDPVCKILHRPTADAYFSNIDLLVDPSTRQFKFRSLEAVTFAAYFAAVASISSQQCRESLGEEKDVLVARYKRSTETSLVKADFMDSPEMPTLQALTIYIVVQRSLPQARFNWSLIGLAMRIAQGLGLHRDGHGQAFSAFEAEMRQRLWWQILALDMRTSEDRATEPIFPGYVLDMSMPGNLDDEDFQYDSEHPLRSRIGPTDMTLCLLNMEALCISRKLNFRSPASESEVISFENRKILVREYAEKVESTYLASGGYRDKRTRLLRIVGRYWVYKLQLVLYYPLHSPVSQEQLQPRPQGLNIAMEFLKLNEVVEQHPSSAGFAWLYKTYVPWHPVAVALSEICIQPQSSLAQLAWELIESRLGDWSRRVIDTKEAMLWGPIRNLMKRARLARQKFQEQPEVNQVMPMSDIDAAMQDFHTSGMSNYDVNNGIDYRNTFGSQSFNEFNLLDQSMDQPLQFPLSGELNTMEGGGEPPVNSYNLDSWNGFTFDINALGGEMLFEP
ncbi:Fc.00g115270.m01.CDS01 [Cosmosporella sp. VM-42]